MVANANLHLFAINWYHKIKEGIPMGLIIAIIGAVAVGLLIWYVYILMRGDKQ